MYPENIRFIVRAEIGANAETGGCCCGLAPRRDALGARCPLRRTRAFEPRLAASGLWWQRDVASARESTYLSWYFGFDNVTITGVHSKQDQILVVKNSEMYRFLCVP